MYLKNIFIENMGAIEKFQLFEKELIQKDGSPRVVILVGQNGSGKTTLLSSIVDSFYQLAQGSFDDVLPKSGTGYKYFKISGASNQRVNTEYGFSYLQFEKNSKKYEYVDKNGKFSFEECKNKTNQLLTLNNNWKDDNNHKENTSTTKDDEFSKDFETNSYCYFPSDRFEYPYWINEETVQQQEQFNDYSSFSGRLDKNIIIRQSLSEIKHWILDIFLDSRTGIIFNEDGSASTENNIENVKQLQQSRVNLEMILSSIIEKDILIDLNYRGRGNSRLKLIDKVTKKDILPSLSNLSAGQSTLLGIFANIIKSSDKSDLMKSINLSTIEGIIIIDEVDLHLHIGLQNEVLPKLIKLFPKVQFILTSHSPFFLNGMAKNFEKDDYIVVNMPSGKILDTYDEFEEFNRAYEVFDDLTNEKREEIKELQKKVIQFSKPLIITEGKTDWKHFKRALEYFKDNEEFTNLDIKFMEYEDTDLKMSESQLEKLITELSKVSRPNKVIGIFDCDTSTGKKYENKEKQKLSNNVYGLAIPTPDFRSYHNGICTEFLYRDRDLKKVNQDGRRIYLSEEFSKKGRLKEDKKVGLENAKKIDKKLSKEKSIIIDSDVLDIDENSLALSKDAFSKHILNRDEPFNTMDFEGFRALFKNIEKILNH